MKWMKLSFVHYIAGMISSILSYWFHSETLFTIGFFLLFLGFLYFALDMKEILTKRVKKKLDAPFSFAVLAILNGLIVHMLAFLLSLFGFGSVETWSWVIYLYITTWILFSILGYLYKIIPFLWWTHKYSEKVGKEEVPMLKVMLNEKLGKVLYWLFSINVVGIITSVALQNGIMLFIFFGLQALTATIYALSIITIFLK